MVSRSPISSKAWWGGSNDLAMTARRDRRRFPRLRRKVREDGEVLNDSLANLLARLAGQPDDAESWYLVARLQAAAGEPGWAFLAASQAARIRPDWRRPVWLMADSLARSGLGPEAVGLIMDRGWVDKSDPSAIFAVSRLAIRAGDPEIALPLLDQVLGLDPDHSGALHARIEMLRLSGEEELARSFVAGLAESNGPGARIALARDAIDRRDPGAALEFLDGTPQGVDVHTLRSRALLSLGRYRDAITEARSALALDPTNRSAQRWLDEAEAQLRVTRLVPVPCPLPRRSLPATAATVLHLVSTSLPDKRAGYTIRSQSIGSALGGIGWDPHFVTPPGFPGEPGAPTSVVVDRVTYHRLSPTGVPEQRPDAQAERFLEEAAPLVERLRPLLLHAHSGFVDGAVALGLTEAFDLPVVYEARGFLEDTWLATYPWASPDADRYVMRRQAETRVMELADAVVTLGETMKSEIAARGIPEDKITVVPNAVGAEWLEPIEPDPTLRMELGISGPAPVVGYVSSLRRLEGIDLLVESISLLAGRGVDLLGLIVGDGPELSRLREMAAALGVGDRIVFTGPVPHGEVARYYALIDVFVVPRRDQRVNRLVTPLKPYEAMAAGRLVIVPDLPALGEVVSDGTTGVTFRAGDAVHLADTISRALTDEASTRRIAETARRWVAEHRTWSSNARRYASLYEDLTGVRPSSDEAAPRG